MARKMRLFYQRQPNHSFGRKLTKLLIAIICPLSFVLLFELNWFNAYISKQLSNRTAMAVTFDYIDYDLYRPNSLRLRQVKVHSPEFDAVVDQVNIKLDLLALWHKQLIIEQIAIKQAKLELDLAKLMATPASPHQNPQQPDKLPLALLQVNHLTLEEVRLLDHSNQQLRFTNGQLALTDLTVIRQHQLSPTHFPGSKLNLSLDNISWQQHDFGQLKLVAHSHNQDILFEQIELNAEPSLLAMKAKLSLPLESSTLTVQVNDSQLQLQQFKRLLPELPLQVEGLVNFNANIAIANIKASDLLDQIQGRINLQLRNGKVTGLDLNSALSALQDSQQTNLLDIGGYLLTGPLGFIAGQLFDLGSGVTAWQGQTEIKHLAVTAQLAQSVVSLNNTALATDKYRIAVKGQTDIQHQRFEQLQFAILTANGCAALSQTLDGDIANPTSTIASSLVKSLTSPLTELLKGVTNTLSDCQVFYSGEVAQP